MATTGGGGAGAVRVSGAPSGGVSGAGAAADDVGSVIDFLSDAGFRGLRLYFSCTHSGLTSKSTRRWLRQPEPRRRGLAPSSSESIRVVCEHKRLEDRFSAGNWVVCDHKHANVLEADRNQADPR